MVELPQFTKRVSIPIGRPSPVRPRHLLTHPAPAPRRQTVMVAVWLALIAMLPALVAAIGVAINQARGAAPAADSLPHPPALGGHLGLDTEAGDLVRRDGGVVVEQVQGEALCGHGCAERVQPAL